MAPDCYKVEVLHYLNPHLIWVEVNDPSITDQGYCFEQLGLYGLLPFEQTLDEVKQTVSGQRCEKWAPAATLIMKKAFDEASEIHFSTVHIDRRSSIFDDNIHKYGDIIITKHNGKQKALSKLLTKSGFALHDECLFYQELHSGNLKTKLSNDKVKDVVKNLEQHYLTKQLPKRDWETSVKKQTKIFHTEQHLESTLTVKNLDKHNSKLNDNKCLTIEELLERKLRDLQLCKGIDEPSVGRASHVSPRIDPNPRFNSSHRMKKIMMMKHQNKDVFDPKSVIDATKMFLEDKAHIKVEAPENHYVVDNNNKDTCDTERKISNEVKNEKTHHFKSEDDNDGHYKRIPKSHNKFNKRRSTPKSIPQYDAKKEKLVTYGPPDINHLKLNLKVVPKEELLKIPEKNPDSTMEQVYIKKNDMYGDFDSDVEVEFTHEDKSKEINNADIGTPEKPQTNKQDVLKTRQSSPENDPTPEKNKSSLLLQRKLRAHRETVSRNLDSSFTSVSDTSNKDSSTSIEEMKPRKPPKKQVDSDDDTDSEVIQAVNVDYPVGSFKKETIVKVQESAKNHVNPFKNNDANISVFVEKLVTPVLMVHSKINKRFQPSYLLRDVNFTPYIHNALKNLSIDQPMLIQSMSWFTILRGYSVFMIAPKGSGKTMGYLPAVCRLISDGDTDVGGMGPLCIIVCATATSVSEVERLSKIFFGNNEKVLACYTGMNEMELATSLLNGCDLLICTPSILVRLLQMSDFGVDLRRLRTFVMDDCERLSEVYMNEVKFFFVKIKQMLKARVAKEVRVQYILSSRLWCDFMEPLAKKAPDTVICIGAFQECVLYSKASTSASFVTKDNKVSSVLEFLKQIDVTKKTVIVCRSDDEVEMLEKALTKAKYSVFACNNTMTVQELYKLNLAWAENHGVGPSSILVCCDGNLTHMNITDAHHLVHYSLPHLFSMFCKRFSVLNDNFASMFKEENESVKIKILFDKGNVEQLPKTLHFIKRCTDAVPQVLDELSDEVLAEKDAKKASNLVPICGNLLAFGECPDFWNCQERHAILKEFDEPKDWVPTAGEITFQILHYHSAVQYSARILSNIVNGSTKKYPQTYNMLAMKISMYFSTESNRRLQGVPKVGDVCAVSVKQNFFVRCQVLKVLTCYQNGNPNHVLIRLLDEETLQRARDIDLYHLPDEMKTPNTHVIHVRLGNIQPKDKDITFSELARQQLKKITDSDEDLYMRGRIVLAVGNCVIVDMLETCRDLTSMNKTVVRHDFREELEAHAIPNPDHIPKLETICKVGGFNISKEVKVAPKVEKKELPKGQWAHIEADDMPTVLFASAKDPGTFFVRLVKFDGCMNLLVQDIQKYVADDPERVTEVSKGDIVLAKFPDDGMYERARVDEILDENKVRCFFVDQGDWRQVVKEDLREITEKFILQMPFQAIECRLIGVKPAGEEWTEFCTNWFTNLFEHESGDLKQIYVKYYTKEKSEHTDGHKYGVAIVDTNSSEDLIINYLIIDVNFAKEVEDEAHYLKEFSALKAPETDRQSTADEEEWVKISDKSVEDEVEYPKVPLSDIFLKPPIRSVPLVPSDPETDDSEGRWSGNIDDFVNIFQPVTQTEANLEKPMLNNKDVTDTDAKKYNNTRLLAIEDSPECDKNSVSDVQEIPCKDIKLLDSDDLSSPESEKITTDSDVSRIARKSDKISYEDTVSTPRTTDKISTDSDVSLTTTDKFAKKDNIEAPLKIFETQNATLLTVVDELRKPKLSWRQNGTTVTLKIILIGVEDYQIDIKERSLKFSTYVHDTKYGFDIELYGVIDSTKCRHSNKGQYILVNLTKILNKKWLSLTRDCGIKKWIVYDVDSLDDSSSDEDETDSTVAHVIKNMNQSESESEDDDFLDDIDYQYGN